MISVFGLHLLYFLATTTTSPVIATQVSRDALQCSANATDLTALGILESPFPYYFPDSIDVDNLFPLPDCSGVFLS